MAALLLKLARQLERAQDLLARFDTLDMLTGVANRTHFMALADREWARARRYGHGAGIVIIEVDRYRRICELRGNAAGDAVMRELATVVGRSLRGADALARYTPSQLVVLLAQADTTGALDVAERVREHAEALEVPWTDYHLRLTISAGVATLRPAHLQLQALVQDAEAAVEAARQAGGNCVRAAPLDAPRPAARDASLGDNRAAGPL
jgi:diguanylate cyclase